MTENKGDLISREALLKRVDEERKYLIARGQTGAEHILVHNFRDLIDNAPTVEIPVARWDCYCEGQKVGYEKALSERPQGAWIGNAFDEHHCNRCGHPALWEEEPDDYYEVQSNFCPQCGADMRGGAE